MTQKVVELQDTPDGLTMMGEDGNEISIDKEQNGNPVDVSTDITEDTVSESQTSDTVINDTESERWKLSRKRGLTSRNVKINA